MSKNRKSKIERGDTPRASVPTPGFLSPGGACVGGDWQAARRKEEQCCRQRDNTDPCGSTDSVICYACFD